VTASIGAGAGYARRSSVTSMTESPDHMSCQEVVELVTAYLEGGLPAAQTALVEQHLNFCEGCVWYVEQLRGTIAAVGRITEPDIATEDRDRLLTAFRGWSTS
jgi:anti-sigma factor RsiW